MLTKWLFQSIYGLLRVTAAIKGILGLKTVFIWRIFGIQRVNKPNKQNGYEIDSFNKFNFSQSQEILDTLIDVRNAKQQNTTS